MKISNKMQHFLRICFRSCFITLSAVIFVLFSISLSFAGNVTFIKEYTYQASELDSKASCRTISLEMVKRLLLEELGTYLISETEVKDFKLTKEQVKTYSAGIVGAEIIEDTWDGKTYWLKAKVSADPKEVSKSLKKIMNDQFKGKELEEMRKKAEELTKEVERLNKELAKGEGKQPSKKIQQEYKTAIQGLTAIEWFKSGSNAYWAQRYEEARDAATKAIELKPDYFEAYGLRALASYALDDYQQAIKDFSKIIKLKPDYGEIYHLRGISYYKLEKYQKAIDDYNNAIALTPSSTEVYYAGAYYAEAYYSRGVVYTLLANHQQAIKDFDKAIELKPDYAEAYTNRGSIYAELGNYQQAIKDCSKAIQLKPDFADVYFVRGVTYTLLGNRQQAIKDFNKAIELKPDYAAAYYNRGLITYYYMLGGYEQSIKDFQIAARLGHKPAHDFLRQEGISW